MMGPADWLMVGIVVVPGILGAIFCAGYVLVLGVMITVRSVERMTGSVTYHTKFPLDNVEGGMPQSHHAAEVDGEPHNS